MPSYTSYLVQTFLTLFVVLGLAIASIFFLRRAGVGRANGMIELLASLPLEARRAVYLLKIGERVFLVGGSESGLEKLGELAASEVPKGLREPARFSDVLRRMQAKPGAAVAPDELIAPASARDHKDDL